MMLNIGLDSTEGMVA